MPAAGNVPTSQARVSQGFLSQEIRWRCKSSVEGAGDQVGLQEIRWGCRRPGGGAGDQVQVHGMRFKVQSPVIWPVLYLVNHVSELVHALQHLSDIFSFFSFLLSLLVANIFVQARPVRSSLRAYPCTGPRSGATGSRRRAPGRPPRGAPGPPGQGSGMAKHTLTNMNSSSSISLF